MIDHGPPAQVNCKGLFSFWYRILGGVMCYFDAGLLKRREKEQAGKRQQVWPSMLTHQSLLSLESWQIIQAVE